MKRPRDKTGRRNGGMEKENKGRKWKNKTGEEMGTKETKK